MTGRVAVLPYGHPVTGSLADVPLDGLIWPLGLPPALTGGTIGDLDADDHLVTFPRTSLWVKALPRCKTSLLIVEPRTVHAKHMRMARLLGRRFHRIFTRDADTLAHVPNARFCPFALSSLSTQDPDTTKTRHMSLIASSKRDLEGHKLRHDLIASLPDGHSVDIMGRGFKPFENKEDGLAPYRFSVVIENTRERGYLSEKLIDALLCRTIPIYWGAPDVGDYFDLSGIMIATSLPEILSAIDGADADLYAAKTDVIETNRAAAGQLGDLYGRVARSLIEEDEGL